jgi:uncharacterized cofD-like protein
MTGVTGNFEAAVRETSRVLAVRGQILPSTLANVTLSAVTDEDEAIHGESKITERGGRIKQVFIHPENAQANPDALRAILNADLIVVGPGSLYTSVLPNLLVDGLRRAMEMSKALKVYVCNVATERGETDSFSVGDHYEVLADHVHGQLFNYVVANNNFASNGAADALPTEAVRLDPSAIKGAGVLSADVVSEGNRYHHDSKKLASTLLDLYDQRRDVPNVLPVPTETAAEAVEEVVVA